MHCRTSTGRTFFSKKSAPAWSPLMFPQTSNNPAQICFMRRRIEYLYCYTQLPARYYVRPRDRLIAENSPAPTLGSDPDAGSAD
jgi:hypothetical protein